MSPYHAWPFLSVPAHPFLSAVWAVLIHGAIALIVLAPILWRSRHRVAYAALAVAGGSLIDVDHFVAAGSTSLHAIETLGGRPATHSLAFIALLAVAALLLTRRAPLAWSVFAVNAAHVMFDAAGGHEQPLYPLGGEDGLPWLLCPVSIAVLVLASALIARRRAGIAVPPAVGERLRTGIELG